MFGTLGKLMGNRPRASSTERSTLDTSALSFTGRMALWSAQHRWWVVAASVVVMMLSVFVLSAVETRLFEGDGGEGEADVASRLIEERFDFVSPPTEQLVFSNPSLGASDPEYRATVERLAQQLRALPEVAQVVTYYDANAPGMVSSDGHVALAQVVLNSNEAEAEDKIGPVLETVRAAASETQGFEIGIVGETSLNVEMSELVDADFARIFMITLVLGLVILLFAFRSVIAALIPLTLAVGAIFSAMAVSTLFSYAYSLVDIYTEMILLMGLAVGIDYSLFIISRFRSERKAGRPRLDAIAVASNTTGRAVFYAGITVVLSLAGLIMTNNTIFISLALAAIFVVLIAIVASLTLLPALLGILGDNVNRLRLPIIGREGNNGDGGIWSAITDKVLAKPGILATLTVAALIAVAAPVASLNLGFNSGSDALPDAIEGKRSLELLEQHFTSGLTAPAFVVVDAPNIHAPEVQSSVSKLVAALEKDSAFFPPFEVVNNPAGDLLYVEAPLVGGIDGEQAERAIMHLREDVIPAAFDRSDARVYVTGMTASSLDFKEHMYSTAPYVFGFVLGLAFLLLLVMFRSIVIPAKAIALNLLSVGAAYGVLVAVFQFGWGVELLGVEATGVIESWLPLFLFGILFGLSMDYHMLVLNRIKEAHDQGHSTTEAVSTGIKVTAGQITSAAAIMVGVFATFALSSVVSLKQFGLGLGVAVLIDATVIRSILLPASMKLLNEWNWYLPKWLEWLPRVSHEGVASSAWRTPEPAYVGSPEGLAPEAVPVRLDD